MLAIHEEKVIQGRKVPPKPADKVSPPPLVSLTRLVTAGLRDYVTLYCTHLLPIASLTPPPQPESSEVVKRMIVSLPGDGSLPPDTLEHLTPELLTRIEPSLITAAIATRKTQVRYYKR